MILKKNDTYIIKEINGDIVILNPETGDYYGLNSVGADFMSLIDGEKTLEEVIIEMDKIYDIDIDTLSSDIKSLTDSLLKKEIVLKIG